MGSDKKKAAGELRYVLLRDVGDAFLSGDVSRELVVDILLALGAR